MFFKVGYQVIGIFKLYPEYSTAKGLALSNNRDHKKVDNIYSRHLLLHNSSLQSSGLEMRIYFYLSWLSAGRVPLRFCLAVAFRWLSQSWTRINAQDGLPTLMSGAWCPLASLSLHGGFSHMAYTAHSMAVIAYDQWNPASKGRKQSCLAVKASSQTWHAVPSVIFYWSVLPQAHTS